MNVYLGLSKAWDGGNIPGDRGNTGGGYYVRFGDAPGVWRFGIPSDDDGVV